MRFHDRIVIADFSAALPEVTNQFLAAIELRASRLIPVKIADQTNAQRNVVQIVAVNVAAINLPSPTIPYLHLAVAGRRAVADHEMVSEPILHSPEMSMVIIKRSRVALTRSAVMHHDVLPATAGDRRIVDLGAH